MKIAIGADHAGYEFKDKVKALLEDGGHVVTDMGTHSKESCDYPDFGLKVAQAVADGDVDYGVNVCWTGNGMAIAANKIKGIRAGIALSVEMAELTRSHNDANVLVMSGKYTTDDQIEPILTAFLTTDFEGGRHIRRLDKIRAAEK